MKRRDALKNLLFASGGMITLPAWTVNWNLNSIPLSNNIFNAEELRTLSSIVDTVIPSNGTIGGISVGVDTFLSGLISECYEKEIQQKIKANLLQLEQNSQKINTSFSDCDPNTREKILSNMHSKVTERQTFFEFMKDESIRGFETSEEVLVKYHNYVLMPGHYDGCVDLETN